MTDPNAIAIQFSEAVARRKQVLHLRQRGDLTMAGGPSEGASAAAMASVDFGTASVFDVPSSVEDLEETRYAERIAPPLAICEERAALSGQFAPEDLLLGVDTPLRDDVLARLAPECSVDEREGSVRWLLNQRRRRSVLVRIQSEGRLAALLEGSLPETDGFGHMLRELLRSGAQIRIDGRDRGELVHLLSAIEATADADFPHPDPREVQRRLGTPRVIDEYTVLLREGFVGREEELRQLDEFVRMPAGAGDFDGFILAGVGGVGKSTLLAKSAEACIDQALGTIVFLDFDRPGIDATDTYWLELEIARQVEQQHEGSADELRSARSEARERRSARNISASQNAGDFASFERSFKSVLHVVGRALAPAGVAPRPLLLVLDTFEEVADNELVEKVVEWLSDVADAISPTRLKVLFSGRLFTSADALALDTRIRRRVDLPDLDETQATHLLELNGVPAPLARRLVASEVLPRRPLELKLLAKLVVDQGDQGVAALEDELRRGEGAAKDMFASVVYQRVLVRIGDPIARQLAYPGLVLRYVTTDVVRNVLVPALTDLPPLDEAEAQHALDALASHEWLAYRDTLGAVWHRKDLRRSMLKAMIAQQPELARRVSLAARKYFEASDDPAHRAEAVYHRLLMIRKPSDASRLSLDEVKEAASFIQSDMSDFPPAGEALFRFAMGLPLSPTEVTLLPKAHRVAAYRANGERLVRSREFGKALSLFENRRELRSRAIREGKLNAWEEEVLFSTASWKPLRKAELRPALPRESPLSRLTTLLYPRAFIEPARVDERELRALIKRAAAQSHPLSGIPDSEQESVLERFAATMITLEHGQRVSEKRQRDVEHIVRNIPALGPSSHQRLQLLHLWATGKLAGGVVLSASTLPVDAQRLLDAVQTPGIEEGAAEYLKKVATIIATTEKVKGVTLTARSFLSAVDTSSTETVVTGVDLRKADAASLLTLLRGLDREFRSPCRFALLEAYPSAAELGGLGRLVASAIGRELADFQSPLAEATADSLEHSLLTIVELVDRLGKLGRLLTLLCEAKPQSFKARDVLNAYNRWNDAARDTITTAAGRAAKE